MTLSYKQSVVAIAVILGILAYFQFGVAHANPDQILENTMGSAAGVGSSSPAYLGNFATTSINSFDTQGDGALPAKSATLLVALTASSSATTLNIFLEFSQNNADWYGDNISGVGATSTQTITLAVPSKYTLTGATSSNTIGGVATAGNTLYRAFTVQVPSRYVRAVLQLASSTVISGGPNQSGEGGTVWSDFIAKKETR